MTDATITYTDGRTLPVQNPPSVGVLRRHRSTASATACFRVSGADSPASSSPGLAVPGPGYPYLMEDALRAGTGQVDVVPGHSAETWPR